jgi:hypothetical protein
MHEYLAGGEMHWIKLLLEGWALLGIATVVLAVFWTNKQSSDLSKQTTNTISPPKLRPEFRTTT